MWKATYEEKLAFETDSYWVFLCFLYDSRIGRLHGTEFISQNSRIIQQEGRPRLDLSKFKYIECHQDQ